MKLFKCRCQIVSQEQRKHLKYGGQYGSGNYHCFGCDSYFAPFTLFNYLMYYIGKVIKKDNLALTDWVDIEMSARASLENILYKINNFIRKV